MKGSDKVLYYLAMSVILCFLAVSLNYFYRQYRPIRIMDIHTVESKILNPDKKVKRGEKLEYEFNYSKYLPYNGVISRMLVNDRIVHLSSAECANLPLGKNERKIVAVEIPKNIFPAKYFLQSTIRYPVGDDRNVTVDYRTEWFEVTE